MNFFYINTESNSLNSRVKRKPYNHKITEISDSLNPESYATRVEASTFPDETFRVLKQKEIRRFGEYRTRCLVLEAWKRLG